MSIAKVMQRRLAVVLLCALMMAGSASYVVWVLANARSGPKRAQAAHIVVAAKDLETGELIHESDVRIAEWYGQPPAGWIAAIRIAVNRGVVSAIYQGEPVTENRLAQAGSGGGLAATIPPGMRACAVRVNDVVGVAGFVVAGMRVDVLITGAPPGQAGNTGSSVRTLLQNIAVLSAGTNIEKDKEGKPQQVQVVNLLVNPRQAEVLSLAGNETRIQLVLRNPSDTGITQPPGSSMADLFGLPRTPATVRTPGARPAPRISAPVMPGPPPTSPVPALQTIEVINGGRHSEARFSSGQEGQ